MSENYKKIKESNPHYSFRTTTLYSLSNPKYTSPTTGSMFVIIVDGKEFARVDQDKADKLNEFLIRYCSKYYEK